MGLAMVDESVFALSELKPGLEKVYFTLEKELMEPKYEIHGLTPEACFWKAGDDAPRQRAAAMLLAPPRRRTALTGASTLIKRGWRKCKKRRAPRWQRRMTQIHAALAKYRQEHEDVADGGAVADLFGRATAT